MNILLSGCSGKMGMNVRESAQDFEGAVIAAGVDIKDDPQAGFPVYDDFSKIQERIDVIIDFSHFSNLENVLGYAVEHRIPAVLCTTGYSEVSHKGFCRPDPRFLFSEHVSRSQSADKARQDSP